MGTRAAWCLNLDAEHELADPLGYQPTAAIRRHVAARGERVVGLCAPDDLRFAAQPVAPGSAVGCEGRAWCPTPRALSTLALAGARLPPAPPLAVLQRTNHRRFAWELLVGPLEAVFVGDHAQALARLSERSPTGVWVAKRAFGFAGRGRRRFFDPPNDAERRWIERSCLPGQGLLIEAWAAREGDCSLHGWVTMAGEVTLGSPVRQVCDTHGVWQAAIAPDAPGVSLSPEETEALTRAGRLAGAALASAGYFGPFGIDAFRYRTPEGALGFHPMVELNARYTMVWGLSGLTGHIGA